MSNEYSLLFKSSLNDLVGNVTVDQFPAVKDIVNGESKDRFKDSKEFFVALGIALAEKSNEVTNAMTEKYDIFPTCRSTWRRDKEIKSMVKNIDKCFENTFNYVNDTENPYLRILFCKICIGFSHTFLIPTKEWKKFYEANSEYISKNI